MARIKGKYRATIELNIDTPVKAFRPFDELKKDWESELSNQIQRQIQEFADPAICKVTQEIAEIELLEE